MPRLPLRAFSADIHDLAVNEAPRLARWGGPRRSGKHAGLAALGL